MTEPIAVEERVRVLRGRWCGRTASVIAVSTASAKVSVAGETRWYALTELERVG